ncbi:relaxase/mobilization nuclease domain-containing protein [Rhizobium leguminosarum]|uniref:relaxase/mobilization nuclease domain-containing protein n=1 Tax=Rhizobium leguminosarum TaxID=384 RepID=UPI00103006B2|nr:relaxase/mobilization nuclease domain-containing protein [Rhizobium leguminosarum]TAU85849.1 hypothetical protein ELI40_22425 [Rhizobium leguminosarum]
MIVQTTRIRRDGGVRYLARHLLDKTNENERIDVLAGDRQALDDAHALASAKGCRYSVRHLSVSPERDMSPAQLADFLRAVDAEFRTGRDRPRLVVRHIKGGRAHFHIAVAEVDPKSLRVLDCRNDFGRLESIARNYEAAHGETMQPARAERRRRRTEGFSDVARKRAERLVADFDRTKLREAFATGRTAFHTELDRQGLRVAGGDKGPILVTVSGAFVAAACRAAGVRRAEFLKFIKEEIPHEQLIGSQPKRPGHRLEHGKHRGAPPAAPDAAGNAGTTGQDRAVAGIAWPDTGRPAPASDRIERPRHKDRSAAATIGRQCREALFLHRLTRLDLDDLLRRAREFATSIRAMFEPERDRLARQIAEAKRMRKSFPPAEAPQPTTPSYDYRRRVTP